ncbi:MAG: heme ABC exporter ATP-binding protein CcmA [Parvularculaceae bacterium]
MGDAGYPPFRLEADRIAARRGGRLAFAGASLSIGPGEIFLLRGPNGAGKSTLLRVLAGRLKPDHGTIALAGAGGDLREATTLVGHADAIKGALTAEEHLLFWRDLYGADDARCAHAADALAISGFRAQRASTLSQGQRRRVALCRPLISGRPIWLLDEPTAGMDAASVDRALSLFIGHAAAGGAVIIAAHEPLGLSRARVITLSEAA